ncbi:formate dehydrogenase subunit alpha [Lutibaculum baratangense]|uniref:Formate dehydrogenase-O, major subunit n=1 Tax=Lutibaculum baratangense AMV1 TaxID=631454 RepID=V4REL3_9HYPH|nr:formate dehydrogenase subunit alpha [Lutibaculum baratangense]ESR24581.1 Formate dehydrogenase-O, major subunit [Lutibaculum baratangense AMV1]
MLRKKSATTSVRRLSASLPLGQADGLDRRTFLRNSGVSAVAAGLMSGPLVTRRASAQNAQAPEPPQLKKTVCPYCAVGCSLWAEVENGVWIGQEPAFESPVNMGTHCAKGAAAREQAIGERRLKYPTKLVGGQWVRVSWEEAIEEIGDRLLSIREEMGPESVYWLGSAKFSNEMAYLCRKFAALWGTNNVDHQARICHSTTVSGVANMYGYGAMTNSFNDIHNAKSIFLLGGNPAEAHPVSMLHLLRAKENGAKLIVVDPRFTRTARHAHEYVRIRPGTDVAFMWGVLHHILENGWEDQEYLGRRVFGFDEVRREVQNYPPDVVEEITGIAAEQVERVARIISENRPGTLIWCMGLTQSHIGNSKTRAASTIQLALGNIGKVGGGANIFRGHDNVQGATDLGLMCHSLPAYYGLTEDAWRHWCRVWDLDYEWVKGRFASQDLMEGQGMPVSRWFDGVLEPAENIDQPNPVRGMIFWGHAPNSQTRNPDLVKGLNTLDTLVVIDPHPTLTAVLHDRTDGVYLLPATTTMEYSGSVTNSQRAVQWREKVVDPIFDAKNDYEIAYLLARKLGFADELFKHIGIEDGEPVAEDITREFNRGTWTIGYTGQSPERLKRHMANQDKFDTTTIRGVGPVEGEFYGLPWPSWGRPEMGHPGTHILYNTDLPVAEGGLPFRARWGVEHEGQNLLAEGSYTRGSELTDGYPEFTYAMLYKLGWNRELTEREQLIIAAIAAERFEHDMFDISEVAAKERLDEILASVRRPSGDVEQVPRSRSGQRKAAAATEIYERFDPEESGEDEEDSGSRDQQGSGGQDTGTADFGGGGERSAENELEGDFVDRLMKVNWKTDLSGGIQRVAIAHGCAPFGNGKARTVVWNFPDPVPVHREPLYTPRRDLVERYRTYDDRRDYRLPVLYWSIQQVDYTGEFPMSLTSGRLVEFEGGGDETRSNKWLAEFQQQMFAEVNPQDAVAAGVSNGEFIWVLTPEGSRVRVAALVTPRVGPGTVFMPFHFGGVYQGKNLADRYPPGTVPYVLGEACNTVSTYGYDVVTFMQESKATLCRIEKA